MDDLQTQKLWYNLEYGDIVKLKWQWIASEFDIGIRIDKFSCDGLHLSRTKVKLLLENGSITCDGVKIPPKTKIKGTMRLSGVFSEETEYSTGADDNYGLA